jgi:hypothetical protein
MKIILDEVIGFDKDLEYTPKEINLSEDYLNKGCVNVVVGDLQISLETKELIRALKNFLPDNN